MKDKHATVGVYKNHEDALDAIRTLKKEGYDESHISIIGKGNIVEDHVHLETGEKAVKNSATVGGLLGSVVGLLTGLGVFAIPGLGVLFMGGAVAGIMGGFSFGLAGGGAVGALTALGIGKDGIVEYKEHLEVGRYLVMLHHEDSEMMHKAKDLLHTDTDVHEVEVHLNEDIS